MTPKAASPSDSKCTFSAWERAHAEKHDLEDKVFLARREALAHALELNAVEVARRLDFLNGEAERLRKMQETYVLRETYTVYHNALCKDVDLLRSELVDVRIALANMRGQIVAYSTAIGIVFAIIGFLADHVL